MKSLDILRELVSWAREEKAGHIVVSDDQIIQKPSSRRQRKIPKISDEHRKKISEAHKKRWAKIKSGAGKLEVNQPLEQGDAKS